MPADAERRSGDVSAGNKAQADREASALFQLVDLHGGGQLVEMAREARLSRRYAELDRAIRDKVRPYLYNGDGRSRLVPIDELIHVRRCYRLGLPPRPPKPPRPSAGPGGALRPSVRLPQPQPQLRFVPSAWEEKPAKATVAVVAAAAAAAALSWLPQKKRRLQSLPSSGSEGGGETPPPPSENRQATALASAVTASISGRSGRHPGDRTLPVCWNLYKRGPVGETILHLCLLQSSGAHETLARRLLLAYPHLMHDIYVSDQYYGETALHMAIVNEDPAMVHFLLKRGNAVAGAAPVAGSGSGTDDERWRAHRLHARRCCGEFFCAADQKSTRRDASDGDWVTVSEQTDYGGHAYFGEYALSFATCLGQEECARMLVACGADIDAQDHNGNTALHMAVVRDSMRMYDVLRLLGAHARIKNRQGLTPLALAARLGRRAAYEHIIAGERRPYWTYGSVVCSAYPLADLDSIGDDGRVNRSSVIELVARGALPAHADMVEGPVVCLLEEKWRAFARQRFYRACALFCVYFALFFVAMFMRVLAVPESSSSSSWWQDPLCAQTGDSGATLATAGSNTTSATAATAAAVDPSALSTCFCVTGGSGGAIGGLGVARASIELAVLAGAVAYLAAAVHELRREGRHAFGAALRHAPDKLLFHCSCAFVMCLVPLRLVACATASSAAAEAELTLATLAMLCTAPYFLFFCRGVRAVGPFVLMIFRMVLGDMLRFCVIYAVFIAGFSQSMHVVFAGYAQQQQATESSAAAKAAAESAAAAAATFSTPLDSAMGMLYLATGQLQAIHDSISRTRHPRSGAVVFVLYLWLAVVLLVNMLVAMMGNTFKLVSETRKEWLRQWANIILVIELSVPPEERRQLRRNYSQPMGGRGDCEPERALVVRERAPGADE